MFKVKYVDSIKVLVRLDLNLIVSLFQHKCEVSEMVSTATLIGDRGMWICGMWICGVPDVQPYFKTFDFLEGRFISHSDSDNKHYIIPMYLSVCIPSHCCRISSCR